MSSHPTKAYVIEPRDLPWTARLPAGVVALAVIASGGTLLIALGVFLAFWTRRRFRNAVAWVLYLALTCCSLPLYFHLPVIAGDIFAGIALSISIAAAFALRRDVQRYFLLRHGSRVEMNPFWNLMFGPAYVNYTLALLFNGERVAGPDFTSIFPSR